MTPGKLISWSLGILSALAVPIACFWLGIQWENRPAGWPNYEVGACNLWPHVPVCWTIHFPDGPGARLARSAADLAQCHANGATLQSALNAQNASLAAWSARGRRETAEAENAVQHGQGAMATAEKARAAISAPLPAADDACARARAVDARLMETLK